MAPQGQTGRDRENDAGPRRCAFLAPDTLCVVLRDNEDSTVAKYLKERLHGGQE